MWKLHVLNNIAMIVQSFYYILLAVCMLARCDVAQADCSYPGGRQPKDLTRLEKLKNKRFVYFQPTQ